MSEFNQQVNATTKPEFRSVNVSSSDIALSFVLRLPDWHCLGFYQGTHAAERAQAEADRLTREAQASGPIGAAVAEFRAAVDALNGFEAAVKLAETKAEKQAARRLLAEAGNRLRVAVQVWTQAEKGGE